MTMPRKSFHGVTRFFAGLLSVIGATSLCSATQINYDVSQPVGPATITGDIVTDGKLGVLAQTDILAYNVRLHSDTNISFDLTNATAPIVFVTGSDLSATATALLFNFSAADSGYFEIKDTIPNFGLCFSADDGCPGISMSSPGKGILFSLPSGARFGEGTSAGGTQVIGTAVAAVPEPSNLAALVAGIALIGFQTKTTRSKILGSKGGEKIESSKNAAGERTYKIGKYHQQLVVRTPPRPARQGAAQAIQTAVANQMFIASWPLE